jgi:hypothetical protein
MTHKDQLLGYRNYKAFKKEFYKSDFDKIKILQKFLNEVLTGESDITPEGISYIREEMGMDVISRGLADSGGLIEDRLFTSEEIKERLSRLEPYETQRFINSAKQSRFF